MQATNYSFSKLVDLSYEAALERVAKELKNKGAVGNESSGEAAVAVEEKLRKAIAAV